MKLYTIILVLLLSTTRVYANTPNVTDCTPQENNSPSVSIIAVYTDDAGHRAIYLAGGYISTNQHVVSISHIAAPQKVLSPEQGDHKFTYTVVFSDCTFAEAQLLDRQEDLYPDLALFEVDVSPSLHSGTMSSEIPSLHTRVTIADSPLMTGSQAHIFGLGTDISGLSYVALNGTALAGNSGKPVMYDEKIIGIIEGRNSMNEARMIPTEEIERYLNSVEIP